MYIHVYVIHVFTGLSSKILAKLQAPIEWWCSMGSIIVEYS